MTSVPEASWTPDPATVAGSNLQWLVDEVGVPDYPALHRWSVDHRAEFWSKCLDRLGVVFADPPQAILEGTAEEPVWLRGARLNIVLTALAGADEAPAVVYGHAGAIHRVSRAELRRDVARCGRGLQSLGIGAGEFVAIVMPMTYEAVVAYLAIIVVGGVVVSIADSFAAAEIATRAGIVGARWVVTQHAALRAGKHLPMFAKVVDAGIERAIVVPGAPGPDLRPGDVWWDDLMGDEMVESLDAIARIGAGGDTTNVLFSSGTTGDPKAIPWTHLTPLKAAMDGHFHQDVHPGDVVAWPTNLGWMMGPWLIYASLMNGAGLALCYDVPTGAEFTAFVAEAGVTMLGVVPSLVAAWRAGGHLETVDWSGIRVFSSTGEASQPDDMAYLMEAAGGRPVIEYCGGTEIGGGYITGTVLQPAIPGTFTTPALGLDLVIVDDTGATADEGELLIVPPSIGLSTTLLNRDHRAVYFADLPDLGMPLRRHGDHMERLPNGYWRALGRVDDTMNLGGIKVSSAELERAAAGAPGVAELAAVAVPPPGGGPERLVLYAVPEPGASPNPEAVRDFVQRQIRGKLNPLFKVHDLVVIPALPRTASAKVMRRTLRADYADPAE